MFRVAYTTLMLLAAASLPTHTSLAGNSTPYYLSDGGSDTVYVIHNGAVVNSFSTPFGGNAIVVRDTVWVNDGIEIAREYLLDGTPNSDFDFLANLGQLVTDSATGPNQNYSIESVEVDCCNPVYVSEPNFLSGRRLFELPFAYIGQGIAYDFSDGTLYTSGIDFSETLVINRTEITHWDLDGNELGSFDIGQFLGGLAYERATDTLWGFNSTVGNLVQFTKTGTILQDFKVSGLPPNVRGGGEMIAIPEPAAFTLSALCFVAVLQRRRRSR